MASAPATAPPSASGDVDAYATLRAIWDAVTLQKEVARAIFDPDFVIGHATALENSLGEWKGAASATGVQPVATTTTAISAGSATTMRELTEDRVPGASSSGDGDRRQQRKATRDAARERTRIAVVDRIAVLVSQLAAQPLDGKQPAVAAVDGVASVLQRLFELEGPHASTAFSGLSIDGGSVARAASSAQPLPNVVAALCADSVRLRLRALVANAERCCLNALGADNRRGAADSSAPQRPTRLELTFALSYVRRVSTTLRLVNAVVDAICSEFRAGDAKAVLAAVAVEASKTHASATSTAPFVTPTAARGFRHRVAEGQWRHHFPLGASAVSVLWDLLVDLHHLGSCASAHLAVPHGLRVASFTDTELVLTRSLDQPPPPSSDAKAFGGDGSPKWGLVVMHKHVVDVSPVLRRASKELNAFFSVRGQRLKYSEIATRKDDAAEWLTLQVEKVTRSEEAKGLNVGRRAHVVACYSVTKAAEDGSSAATPRVTSVHNAAGATTTLIMRRDDVRCPMGLSLDRSTLALMGFDAAVVDATSSAADRAVQEAVKGLLPLKVVTVNDRPVTSLEKVADAFAGQFCVAVGLAAVPAAKGSSVAVESAAATAAAAAGVAPTTGMSGVGVTSVEENGTVVLQQLTTTPTTTISATTTAAPTVESEVRWPVVCDSAVAPWPVLDAERLTFSSDAVRGAFDAQRRLAERASQVLPTNAGKVAPHLLRLRSVSSLNCTTHSLTEVQNHLRQVARWRTLAVVLRK